MTGADFSTGEAGTTGAVPVPGAAPAAAMSPRGRSLAWCLVAAALLIPAGAGADALNDQVPTTADDFLDTLFPNWEDAMVGHFVLQECSDADCGWCTAGNIVGLTILNYGTATASDLSAVYFNLLCGKTNAWATLTYANVWTIGAESRPAWTWAGNIPWSADPCAACSCNADLRIYVDVAGCPANGATVELGLGFNDLLNPGWPGGLSDSCGMAVPWWDQPRTSRVKYIRYLTKTSDREFAAPGDTVSYTIHYGLPGGPSITNVVVTDSLPERTHYVAGSASTPPDAGWNPDTGPPLRLRWTLPGAATTAGGPTRALSFQATVDWGNCGALCPEPDSGDLAAVEGARLENVAALQFLGSGCGGSFMNAPTDTVVRRYRMWKIADQDLLFAPRIGYPDDEITYSISIRNESTSKTWWNVTVWETVPAGLTTWAPGGGFFDPCVGWTMTPTGCAQGSPGWTQPSPGVFVLTWKLDLPPDQTLEINWRASANKVMPGDTAVSKVSVMALGDSGKIGGTGHAWAPREFIHVAPVALRTTYFSYVGQAANSSGCAGLAINFYPLNRATVFELRKLFYEGKAPNYASVGGKSASIVDFQGTCSGGFLDGGVPGCGAERAPARYLWPNSCTAAANIAMYKLTANAPLLWILMPEIGGGGDALTYIPSTSLTFSGFTHYSHRRSVSGETKAGWGESWVVINTGIDVNGVFREDLRTTVHIFRWNPVSQAWDYVKGNDIDKNSLWMPFAGCSPAEENHYKIISSDARLLVYQGYATFGDPNITFGYNEHGGRVPNAENGLTTSTPGAPGAFYPIANHSNSPHNIIVGNHSAAAKAQFRVYHYRPKNPGLATVGIPPTLAGASGSWDLLGNRTADAGLAGADNAHVFGAEANADPLTAGDGSTANAWKIEWVSGGNIGVHTGIAVFRAWAGGSVMHTVDGKATGQEFWFHHASTGDTWAILLFCPSAGMAVRATSSDGYFATYTTDGPDQCVFFSSLSAVNSGGRRNYKFELLAGGTQGEMMTMYHQAEYREKFFAAPFVNSGVHYDVIVPPIVYAGQSFWITVVAVLGNGITKTDYVGTAAFTSTDAKATINGTGMGASTGTWGAADQGVRIFINVVMNQIGRQTIVVSDLIDGSITGVASVTVVGVDVKFYKEPRLSVAASGDTVQFRICWSNYSSATASSFTVTDAVPVGTTYVPETASNLLCSLPAGVTADVAYSTSTSATAPASFTTTTGMLPDQVRWLRWTIRHVNVNSSGCVCFRTRVD